MSDAYHTALKGGRVETAIPCLEVVFSDGSRAFHHDLLDGPLPSVFDCADVFYADPPWPTGFVEFEERALGDVTPGRSWGELIAHIGELVQLRPSVLALGSLSLPHLPAPDAMWRGWLNDTPCVFYAYGLGRIAETNSERVLDRLAEQFDCVGDFMCGYGRSGQVFRAHGKRFVLSDYNESCIGYIAEHGPLWPVGIAE